MLTVCTPKRDLVAKVQSLLQTGALKIAETLALADVLTSELLAFRAKISRAGRDTYEAWRESDHDDLVLALALACWYKKPLRTRPLRHASGRRGRA